MLDDVLVHLSDVVNSIKPARDAALIRHHSDRDAGAVELGDRLRRPWDELDAVDRADVSMIDDDRPVAIEKDPRSRRRCAYHEPPVRALASERRVQSGLGRFSSSGRQMSRPREAPQAAAPAARPGPATETFIMTPSSSPTGMAVMVLYI
jgi:hypothetical protein